MSNRQPETLNGAHHIGQPEPGIRYDDKLVREMSDNVMQHATALAIANVIAFELDRRSKSILVPRLLV